MLTKSLYNAKHTGNSFFKKFIYGMSMNVHADEPAEPGEDPKPNPAPSMNYEEMIARVRREEKDKLYGTIKKKDETIASLRESNNGYILQIAEYQKKLEEAQKQSNPDEVKQLNDKIAELTTALEEAKKNAPDEAAIREQVKAEYEVKMYAKDELAKHQGDILSIFADEVKGGTREEVDASIKAAVEKSTKVKKDLGLIDEDGNPVEPKGKKKSGKEPEEEPGKKKKTNPPVASPAKIEDEGFDPDYIRNLDPRSPEYAEFRKKMGLR